MYFFGVQKSDFFENQLKTRYSKKIFLDFDARIKKKRIFFVNLSPKHQKISDFSRRMCKVNFFTTFSAKSYLTKFFGCLYTKTAFLYTICNISTLYYKTCGFFVAYFSLFCRVNSAYLSRKCRLNSSHICRPKFSVFSDFCRLTYFEIRTFVAES